MVSSLFEGLELVPGVRQEEWPEGAAMCLVTPRARSMSGVPAGLEVHHSHGALDSTLDSR